MRRELLKEKEIFFDNLEKYFLSFPPLPPIDAVKLANIIGIKFESFKGMKENIKNIFLVRNRYKLMGFSNSETNTIHYNEYLNKAYLNFMVAHECAHLLGKFPSPPIWDTESEEINKEFLDYKKNPLSETISDTFAYALLYPRSHFIFSLLEFGIRKTFDGLSVLYPQANILFKILFNLNKNSFFIFLDPIHKYFSQFTLKILRTQETNILGKENIIYSQNMILSKTTKFGPLAWFGNVLDEHNILSHIYTDEKSKKILLEQFVNNGLYTLAEHIKKEKKFNTSYCGYGNYKFSLYDKKKNKLYDIDSKFFHIFFPFYLIGRTSGKKFLVLALAIEDNEEFLLKYNKDKDNVHLPNNFIKDFDDNTLTFDIFYWFNRLREILNYPKKNYSNIYGEWPKVDYSKLINAQIPLITPPPSRN